MKKSALLLALVAFSSLLLSACGTKEYDMSFEDAIQATKHSERKDLIFNSDTFHQHFDFQTNLDIEEGTSANIILSSEGRQSLSTAQSESSISFDTNIKSNNNSTSISGDIELKTIPDAIYIRINSLGLGGDDASLALVSAMTEGFKNKRFSIPTSGLLEASLGLSDYLKNFQEPENQNLDLYINEGLTKYEGIFTDYQGYNARKFSLNKEMVNELIKEYSELLNSNTNKFDIDAENDEENTDNTHSTTIEDFEGYLVITGKEEVSVIIEKMDIKSDDVTLNLTYVQGKEGINRLLSSEGENIISLSAKKSKSNYNINFDMTGLFSINGTITPSISKSSINLNFDLTANITSSDENNTIIIPMKGSWGFAKENEITVSVPEDAQDLSELLGAYLGNMLGGNLNDYNYEYDENIDYDNYAENDYDYSDANWNDYLAE